MNKTQLELFYGAALHDIGKVIQRYSESMTDHAELGADYFNSLTNYPEIENQIRFHHKNEIQNANLEEDNLAYITYLADNIASATDRRIKKQISGKNKIHNHTNQEDVFNHLYEMENERYYKPVILDEKNNLNFASEQYKSLSNQDYSEIVDTLTKHLECFHFNEDYSDSLLELLESTLTYVPSSTNIEEAVDISLYDHLKLTAALATCIYQYLEENDIKHYKEVLFDKSATFYQEEVFCLVSFDISGIQSFIYTIQDAKAARMLRSRSFYLEILAENLIDELLNRLNLSRANLLYSGGGNAYLIIPNTKEALTILEQVETEINQFLRGMYGHSLYIAFGSAVFNGDAAIGNEQDFGQIYQQVGQAISEKKLNRYTADELLELNNQGKKTGRECTICHTIHENESELCTTCDGLIRFSPALQKQDFFKISKQKSPLPLGFDNYLHSVTQSEIEAETLEDRIYAKNKFYISNKQSIHLWIGDYYDKNYLTFNEYAESSKGIKRLAVVRCDVDDLGKAFVSGFDKYYNTLSRSATFSRSMSLFFKYYINIILKKLDATGTIIYSGGDDVFVVGEWQDMLKFSIELRQHFINYTQGKLTLSTGIGLYPAKTPISIMAIQTGKLEEAAKDNGKDSITLFKSNNTFKWNDFINNIWHDKLPLIRSFFEENRFEAKYGKSFIYNLLHLINSSNLEIEGHNNQGSHVERGTYKTISWAQWAYYLSRMEPKAQNKKASFQKFAQKLHEYFADNEEIHELKMALELYLYEIREGQDNDTN